MNTYLTPVRVGGLEMKNRIIRSATFEYAADEDGRLSASHSKIYTELAKGGVGAIITGMVAVDENSRLNLVMPKAYNDAFENDLRLIANQVHEFGCPIIVQISHCGIKASLTGDGGSPYGPSSVPLASGIVTRAMTNEQIAAMVQSFAEVAARCKRAGADAVQIHAAHGYGISQFLSPYYNMRNDQYGGDITGRGKVLFEVYDAVRQKVGAGYPIWVKINSKDKTTPGLNIEDSTSICLELDKRGIDAIELSSGINEGTGSLSAEMMKKGDPEGFNAQDGILLSEKARTDIISVGGFRSATRINDFLKDTKFAALSLSRPLISEPNLIDRWKSGDKAEARCISCNKCYKSTGAVSCQVFKN